MLRKLLSFSKLYNIFSQIIAPTGATDFFFEHEPGIKVLDVGCGPGSRSHYFTDSRYLGIDLSAKYIKTANERYEEYENINFLQADVNTFFSEENEATEKFDLVILCGILHHLSDDEIENMLSRLGALLNSNGELRTFDGVYTDNQPRFAKYALKLDRGKHVRSISGYEKLIAKYFPNASYALFDNLLRIPYTHIVFSCCEADSGKSM